LSIEVLGDQGGKGGLGTGAQLGDDLAGAEGAKSTTAFQTRAFGIALQEAGGIEIAGAGGVD
jgi:hypothetical protein